MASQDCVSNAVSSSFETIPSWVSEANSIASSKEFFVLDTNDEKDSLTSVTIRFLDGRRSRMELDLSWDSMATWLMTWSSGMTKADVRATSGKSWVNFMVSGKVRYVDMGRGCGTLRNIYV